LGAVGALIGMTPLIIENLADGFLTLAALLQPPDLPVDPPAQLLRFFRVGVPVLLGLGQPTTSQTMFDQDWLQRPAGHVGVALLAVLALTGVVLLYVPAVRRLISCGADVFSGPALLVMLAIVVPPVVALTRFGFFVSEPRYALPLYGTVPLLAGALWRIHLRLAWPNVGRSASVVMVLAFNLWSLLSTDFRLMLALGSLIVHLTT